MAAHAPCTSPTHYLQVLLTFVEQLLLPFLLLMPHRRVVATAAAAELLLQLAIVATGNYAWINFITAVPCLAAFDDQLLLQLPVLRHWHTPLHQPAAAADVCTAKSIPRLFLKTFRIVSLCLLTAFIAVKSMAPLKELTQPNPWLQVYVLLLLLLLPPPPNI